MGLPTTRREWGALAVSIVVCELAGILPAAATSTDVSTWYPTLEKPAFSPPNWVFGPVWTALFFIMGVALFLVWRDGTGRSRRLALGLFAAQLLVNASWSLVFFGRRSPLGGLVIIVALLVLIVATIVAFARINRRAALLLVPYLAWVGFATALNGAIWWLN